MPLRSLVCGAAGGIVRRPLPFQCLLLPNGGNPLVARDLVVAPASLEEAFLEFYEPAAEATA